VINWHFTPEVQAGAFRDRVRDGTGGWNAVQSSVFRFSNQPEIPNYDGLADCNMRPDRNAIHYQVTPGAFAATSKCVNQGQIEHATLTFDSASTNWYKGTGNPANHEVDVWSTASHEWGHMTGWGGHFGVGGPQCSGAQATWQTMCNSLGPGEKGKTFRRSLEGHDQHTFDNQYA
jgi:hypothetical protein